MAKKITPPQRRLTSAEQQTEEGLRRWRRGYHDGYADGHEEGEQEVQRWLLAELDMLMQDVRLGLRHDMGTPLEALAAVRALVEDGRLASRAADE